MIAVRIRLGFFGSLAFGLLWLTLPLAAAPRFVRDQELVDRVVDLLNRRLALMPEIAALKFRQHKSIADPAREREVLDQAVRDAQTMHLDVDATRAFFAAQIQMARSVQKQLFARWHAGATPPPARDLVKELRPELDALGRELLPAVYLASPALVAMPAPSLQAGLSRLQVHAGVTAAQLAELVRALRTLRLVSAPDWNSLQRVGVLRVGTTGDYAPYSDERDGRLHGLDIELAEALAKTWGLSAVFVRTSWPTLMDDLRQQRFDLAASGISITDERRHSAEFSVPYLFDGKMPIACRENAARFSSLAQIDQPGVRVIVNPGGTNERFAREHLSRATIIVHSDNRTIFDELAAGRADVMITDGIEVRLQIHRHPDLQATMTGTLTHTGKAFLLPRDSDLAPHLDAWLKSEIDGGAIAKQMAAALDN